MQICRRDALIEVRTPAKVNLFLEVLHRRTDGFHDIETLIAPIGLYDTLECRRRADDELRIHCRWTAGRLAAASAGRDSPAMVWGDLPQGEANLVYRALGCLRQRAGVRAGVEVTIWKRIPAAAGLGGASSDAAAALLAANDLWDLHWPRARLAEIAAEVGSDVPFFLAGSAAICRGRGERIEAIGDLGRIWLVVVQPPQGLSTADVYRDCRPAENGPQGAVLVTGRAGGGPQPGGCEHLPRQTVETVLRAARRGDAAGVGRGLFNRLQPAAEARSPWIARLKSAFAQVDCVGHQMSGSGSSYFGICRHAGHARRVGGQLRAADLGAVFVTATLGSGLTPEANHTKEERHADHRGSHQAHGPD